MRRTLRTVAVTAPALVVVALAWLRLEQPIVPLWRVLALLALPLAAAVPPRRWLRAVGAVVATVAAARLAVGVDLVPWRVLDPGSAFGLAGQFATLEHRFGTGLSDFYDTHLPFDPRVHAAMGELVLAAIFAFSLAIALFAAARKPVGSATVLLVGAGWPATLLGPSHGVAMGAAILAAALVVLAGLSSRRVPALALPAAAVVALGAVAVGSATAARHGLVHWQSWNLTHTATGGQVGVGFVWDARYGGLRWPAHPTVLLRVQSDDSPSYLRAAVLDDFVGDAWSVGVLRTADYLEPAAALRPSNQTRANVTVEALADTRLVGGSIPVRFAAGGAPLLGEPDRGFASLDQGLPRDFRYSVWSFTARPTAGELRRSPPQYPSALAEQGLLDVGGGVTMPPFGAPHRTATVEALVARSLVLGRYLPLEHLAEKVAGRARTPYDAAASLESWFLDSGGFRYSNHPTEIAPALVSFVAHTKTGYCQYFAGAMALMLRYLGIPARVAVGFAGGRYDSSQKAWLVTDRDAHAWVEAWFKGYGWLPFDPTPPAPGAARRAIPAGPDVFRGGATVPYSNVAGTGSVATGGTPSVADNLARKNGLGPHHGGGTAGPAVTPARRGGSSDRGRPVLLMLLVLAAAVGAIVLAKAGVRIARGTRRDPRRVAAACREELAAFLVDQRVEAPRSATVRELGAIVEQEFAVSAELFVAAATAARFGPAEEAAAAAQAGRRELRELLDAARRSLTWRERLLGLLSLRSLTRPATRVDASASLDTGMVGSTGS